MTRLYWAGPGPRVYGSIVDRTRHGTFRVLWDDGRVGVFVEGKEPPELRVAPTGRAT